MIVIKDKKMGEVWKIIEPGEIPFGSHERSAKKFVVPLIKVADRWFDTASEAIVWVGQQIEARRTHLGAPKPATFWNPH